MEPNRSSRAISIEDSFSLCDGISVLGCLQSGVTVYNQQVRAHNLLWSIKQIVDDGGAEPNSIAIVGGGIGGLTAAACALALFSKIEISLFEKQWELCPLQLGSDNRWLHPRIYDWPDPGSRAPSASLPLLNWTEGRASDVARQIISGFAQSTAATSGTLSMHLGVRHLKINSASRMIEWMGNRAVLDGGFLKFEEPAGNSKKFDRIILATGFGLECTSEISEAGSYWQNERLGQPAFDGQRQTYLISGYGDGALVDLCRLVISRFRQDSIVYELFPNDIETMEVKLLKLKHDIISNPKQAFDLLEDAFDGPLADVPKLFQQRFRNDTRVVMHLSGKTSNPKRSIADLFSGDASFLNKLALFALYKSGGFIPYFGSIDNAVNEYGIAKGRVLIRHGTQPTDVLRGLFTDEAAIDKGVCRLRAKPVQTPERCWVPGIFPT